MRLEVPSFTLEYQPGEFRPVAGATYIFGQDILEQRGESVPFGDTPSVSVLRLAKLGSDDIVVTDSSDRQIAGADLHDSSALRSLLASSGDAIYLDITSMEHKTWAPLVKAAIEDHLDVKVVYTQPKSYTKLEKALPGLFWDLSEEIEGIAPLPGFIKLRRDPSMPVKFVPLLGFEGNRFEYLVATEEIDLVDIHPIVGSPGFRIEYPTQTVLTNRRMLESSFVHARREYAKANCPFDLFFLLENIRSKYPACLMLLAPIGTKPHALGAILQAVAHPDHTEVLYDHPVRKPSRSRGDDLVCLYDIGAFASEVLEIG